MASSERNRQNLQEWLAPIKVVLIYAVVAALWIAFSDRVVAALASDKQSLLWLNTIKGWFFVAVTALMLYWLIRRDVQALRRNDIAIISAEERYRRRYEAIDVGVTVQNVEGKIIYLNNAASHILGVSKDQLLGRTSTDPEWDVIRENGEPFPGEDHPAMQSLRTGQAVHDVVMGIWHPTSQSRRWIMISSEPIIDGVGSLQEVVATFVDITARKQAEEALEEAEAKYKSLVEESLFGVYILQDDKFAYVNQRVAEIFGYTVEELLSLPSAFHLVASGYSEQVRENFRKRFEHEKKSVRYQSQGVRKSGETVDLEVMGTLTTYLGRDAIIGSVLDVTERLRAEESLRHSEERYRSLVESLSDWLWEIDENGLYTFIGPRIRELLGYEPEELIGKSYVDLMQPSEAVRVSELFMPIAEKREPFALLENTLVHKDGHLVVVETSGAPIFDVHGHYRGYRGIDRDITEKKRAEDEIRQRREHELQIKEEAEEAKRRFYQTAIASITDGKLNLVSYDELESLLAPATREMVLTSPDDLANLRLLVTEVALSVGMLEEKYHALNSAVGEAAANAIKHANGGVVKVGATDNRVQVYIRDDGPGIDALALPKATLLKGYSTKPSMGMGYSIILASVDTVYLATEREGTRILLEKIIVEPKPRALIDSLLDSMPDNW